MSAAAATTSPAATTSRVRPRLLAPEVVQTSSMDCGPAALKCLLEGHHIPVSYGRLREACQTSVDGTSIDTIEVVATRLGLDAEQVLVPTDHALLPEARTLPAILVVHHADNATHFVVVWRRIGDWLQVMDPAIGRRWVRAHRFADEIFRHETAVDARDWRDWAGSDDCRVPLVARMTALGMRRRATDALVKAMLADATWFRIAALDASVRLVAALVAAGGIARGAEARALVLALVRRTLESSTDIFAHVPEAYWSVIPDATNVDPTRQMLRVRGAVMVRVRGAQPAAAVLASVAADPTLAPELAAALAERPDHPMRTLWRLLREDGLLAPLALAGAMAIATAAVMLEALLFRGIFDLTALLGSATQRLGAVAGLLAFLVILLAIEIPIVLEVLRQGRHLEARLRMALLKKLPRLNDRYFQSRPISDMADRAHAIGAVRSVPGTALGVVQSVFELAATLGGIVLIAPSSAWPAAGLVLAAAIVPLASQPLLNERDLRTRNHAAALGGFHLDALLGLVPIRAHRAERNVRRQHESLLVEWVDAMRRLMRSALVVDAAQAVVCTGFAGWLLVDHFVRAGGVGGSDLLLVYWTLKLPALGARLASLAHVYPAQRNALLRLLEPLAAPEEQDAAAAAEIANGMSPLPPRVAAAARRLRDSAVREGRGVSLAVEQASVVAAGHRILERVDLRVAPGEHVAIVGPSGAGKSSLVGVLLGWHHLASGRVLVDGLPLDGTNVAELRRVTAWIDPGIQIWNRSFLENLDYACEATPLGRIGEVTERARLRGVVEKLPQGLQTLLGEGGALLSGGEGQRVRLARALLAPDTRLALLDEPFRGMDRTQREQLLAEARAWWRGVTLLCVTHDVGETLDFDRVLVVEGGRIVEEGAPRSLAERTGRYRALLDAEAAVRDGMWQGPGWRRVRVAAGRVADAAGVA